jgi:hypothetical protein
MSKHFPQYLSNIFQGGKKSKNRRQAQRYSPSDELNVCLGWNQGTEYRYSTARLVNLSVSGALLQPKELPPVGQPFWLRLDDPDTPEWIEAKIVEVKDPMLGEKVLRLVFKQDCPYAFFKAAVNGFKPADGFMTPPAELKHPEWW